MDVERRPDREVGDVRDARAVLIADEEIYDDRLVGIVEGANRETVGCGGDSVGDVSTLDIATHGVCPAVASEERVADGLPVVLDTVGIDERAGTHDILCLSAQAPEDIGIRTRELHLDSVRRRDREVVLAHTDIGVGVGVAERVSESRDDVADRLVVAAVDN